ILLPKCRNAGIGLSMVPRAFLTRQNCKPGALFLPGQLGDLNLSKEDETEPQVSFERLWTGHRPKTKLPLRRYLHRELPRSRYATISYRPEIAQTSSNSLRPVLVFRLYSGSRSPGKQHLLHRLRHSLFLIRRKDHLQFLPPVLCLNLEGKNADAFLMAHMKVF